MVSTTDLSNADLRQYRGHFNGMSEQLLVRLTKQNSSRKMLMELRGKNHGHVNASLW